MHNIKKTAENLTTLPILPLLPLLAEVQLTPFDLHLFNEGNYFFAYKKLGAHFCRHSSDSTWVHFAVWAPNAEKVAVVGDFNGWQGQHHLLHPQGNSGIWCGAFADLSPGSLYKYEIHSRLQNYKVLKADPFAFSTECPPRTASRLWSLHHYHWQDQTWMEQRWQHNALSAPWVIFEVHLGSWCKGITTYKELAQVLPSYVAQLGFTHIEFMPVMEHPFYGSWGYQITGFFAPSARYGPPEDFMLLIDTCHQQGLGVILDWVPSHFPGDEHGLAFFDGTHLFEHADPRQGFHPDWKTYIFNYERLEVQSFLLANAFFWCDLYHADALRVDAVASMLYLDYSRPAGQWIPNKFGGRENLAAVSFLQKFNSALYQHFPHLQTIAEESTSWPGVTLPTHLGGLGFGMKWDMGWMHDTLNYMQIDPLFRSYHHHLLTFRLIYAFHENFILSLSHDEVVYGKGSLLQKMPGDLWQKQAQLRLLLTLMTMMPGKKLLFMGQEIPVQQEWNHEDSVDLPSQITPTGRLLRDLWNFYRQETLLPATDFLPEGFAWPRHSDPSQSVLAFYRQNPREEDKGIYLFIGNFTPTPRFNYHLGVKRSGVWRELINSDSHYYGGSNLGNGGQITALAGQNPGHGEEQSLLLVLPPLAALILYWSPTS